MKSPCTVGGRPYDIEICLLISQTQALLNVGVTGSLLVHINARMPEASPPFGFHMVAIVPLEEM
jgi:hypothetical protein